jgi:hypothetical protein
MNDGMDGEETKHSAMSLHDESGSGRVGAQTTATPSDHYRTLFNEIDQGFCTIELLFDAVEAALDYRRLRQVVE